MKKTMLLALVALAACAPAAKRSVSVVIDADFATGKVKLTCRDSSSGTCHALFTDEGGGEPLRLSAAKGASAEANGLGEGAQFCIGETAPANGCRLMPLRDGAQILRNSVVKAG